MKLAFRCRECGEFDTGVSASLAKCPNCGAAVKTYHSGIEKREGYGSPPPIFKRRFSRLHGCQLTSWDEYHRANKALGLVDTGEKPHMDDLPGNIDHSKFRVEEIHDGEGYRDGTHARVVVGR